MATRARVESNAWLRRQAAGIGGRVLSIGSGRDDDGEGGRYRDYFQRCASYTTSEVTASPSCDLVIDVQDMREIADGSYQCVFFSGVAEHIADFQAAFREIERVLAPGGVLLVGVPFAQPIHMAPHDFWRFTEHGLRQVLHSTGLVVVELTAIDEATRNFPSAYWAKAVKPLGGGFAGNTRFRFINTFFNRRDVSEVSDHVDRLRQFDPALAALIDQPEILDVRKWEYGALLEAVQSRWAGLRVLDIGCGRSLFSAYLQSLGAKVVTFDLPGPLQEQDAALARRRRLGMHHVQGNMVRLPFADAAFDLVLSISAIEHLHEVHGHPLDSRPYAQFIGDTVAALAEMARVVAPGGHLFLTSDLFDADLQVGDAWRPTPQVLGGYPIDRFRQIFVDPLTAAGLQFEHQADYDPLLLREDPERAIYRGRYFTTFSLLMRRHGPIAAATAPPAPNLLVQPIGPAAARLPAPARVHVVLSDRDWILEECGKQLQNRLEYLTVGSTPDPESPINYYINYLSYADKQPGVDIAFFTHLEERIPDVAEKFWRVAREVNVRVCMAELYADVLRAQGLPDVHLIGPGVDLDRFRPVVRVGVAGRTYASGRKGEDLVRQVMDVPGIEWQFTGKGWPGPSVNYPAERMSDFYNGIDYLLVPSHYEGGPMPVLEALACGRPVIAPRVGFVSRFPHIEYQAGNAESLRQVLRSVVEERQALRQAVRSTTWEAWAEQHDRLFRSVAPRAWTIHVPRPSIPASAGAQESCTRKLEIGSGNAPREGYEHLDVRADLPHVEHVHDFREPLPFEDGTFDEILAWSCLEHVSWRAVRNILQDWRRALKPGGILEIWVPDIEYLCHSYVARQSDDNFDRSYVTDAEDLLGGMTPSAWFAIKMFGGQDYPANYHMSCFDWMTLSRLLSSVGFESVERLEPLNGLHVRATRDFLEERKADLRARAGAQRAPAVSVVMSAYNAERHLATAVESILTQSFTDFEFIVVNDGSTDGTGEILRGLRDPRIRLLESSKNQGLTRSLNAACRRARGRYIARMDSDDISLPDRLARQVEFLDRRGDCGLVGVWPDVLDEIGGKGGVVELPVGSDALKRHLRLSGNALVHGSVMFRRSVFQAVGGYDESYHYAQDYDLWLRVAERTNVDNIPMVLYRWRQSPAGISHVRALEQQACADRARGLAEMREGRNLSHSVNSVPEDELTRMTVSCVRLLARSRGVLCIWGAGGAGRRARTVLTQHGIEVDAFIDSNPTKVGTSIDGLPVWSPACLSHPGSSAFAIGVLVASAARDDIRVALRSAGRFEGDDFVVLPPEFLQ